MILLERRWKLLFVHRQSFTSISAAQAKRLSARHAHIVRSIGHGVDDNGDTLLLQELGVCDMHDVLSNSSAGK